MKNLLFLLLLHCTFFLTGQYTLVTDLNEGPADTGCYCDFGSTFNQDCAVAINESLTLIKLRTSETDWELYKINSEGVSLVKDINPGEEDSRIDQMTLFKGKVYFTATDGTEFNIYESDGTTEGTVPVLGFSASSGFSYNGFIIGKDEKLYFEFKGSIFSFDGTDTFEYAHSSDIKIIEQDNQNSRTWCNYKDGIAIMNYNGSNFELLAVNESGVTVLNDLAFDDDWDDSFGLAEFEGGLVFSFANNPNSDIGGLYNYIADTGEVTKLGDQPAYRVIDINTKSCLVSINSEFLIFDGENPEGRKIHEEELQISTGDDWYHGTKDSNVFYQSTAGFFLDDTYSFYDAVTGESTEVYVAERDLFPAIQIGSFAVFGGNTIGNTDEYSIYAVSLYDGSLEEIVSLGDPESFNVNIKPITIIDNELYFFGDLENDPGQEIYKASIDLKTSLQNIGPNMELSLNKISEQEYLINHSSLQPIKIIVSDVSGRVVQSIRTSTNTSFRLPEAGMYFVYAFGEVGHSTFKVITN